MDEFLDPDRRKQQEQLWIGACAQQLRRRWRTVDPDELDAVAASLTCDPVLRALSPMKATVQWLRQIGSDAARGQPGQGEHRCDEPHRRRRHSDPRDLVVCYPSRQVHPAGAIMALESTLEAQPAAGRVVALAGRFASGPERAPLSTALHLIHGKSDPVIDYRHTVTAADRLQRKGANVTTDVIDGLGHGINGEAANLLIERLKGR